MNGLVETMRPYAEILRAPYENTYDLPGRSLQAYWQRNVSTRASKAWDSWHPDIIHLNKQNLEDGLDLLRALKHTSIPNLSTIHITQSAQYLKAARATLRDTVSKRALRTSTGPYVTVSDKRRADLNNFLADSPAPIHTVYNGIPTPQQTETRTQLREQILVSGDEILITMVGRLTAQKSPDIFLDQAQKYATRYPRARFLWIGSGEDAATFDATVHQRSLEKQVQRLEWQDNVDEWLQASDIYLHTAAYEGLPLALLEALGAGLPCLTSIGVIEEAEPLKHSPILCYDRDWEILLRSPGERCQRGSDCRSLFDAHFTAEKMAQGYIRLYTQLLQKQIAA